MGSTIGSKDVKGMWDQERSDSRRPAQGPGLADLESRTHHGYRKTRPVWDPRGGVLLLSDSTVQRSADRRDLQIDSEGFLEDRRLENAV